VKDLNTLVNSFIRTLPLALVLTSSPSFSEHGVSTWGKLKYPSDFKCFDYANPQAPQGGEVIHGALGTFDSLNMYIVKGMPAAGLSSIYGTLLAQSFDEVNASYGYIAQDISVSPDRLSVTFTLNPKAIFSDGTKITAEDVVFSFNALRQHGFPMMRSYYKDVDKVEAKDEDKVVFTLKNGKNKELPSILGQVPVFSKKFHQTQKFFETFLTPPPSSGPYKIESLDVGRSITYVKIDNWWGNDLPCQKGMNNFKRIRHVYYRDMNALFEAFKAGNVDLRIENTARLWNTGYDFDAVKTGKVIKESIPHKMPTGTYGLFFNIRRDIFKKREVRKALTLLFDFAWANKNLFYSTYKRNLSYFPNSDFITQGTLGSAEEKILQSAGLKTFSDELKAPFSLPEFTNEADKRKTTELALSLLKEQGYEIKNQKLVSKGGKQFGFEILIYDRTYERVLSNFVQTLKQLGIDVRIRLMDTASYQDRVDTSDFDMIVGGLPVSNSPGNEMFDYFGSSSIKSKGTRNFAGIQDPVVDNLVENITKAENYAQLTLTMRALDRVLLNGYYMIPAWHRGDINIAYWAKFEHPKVIPAYNPLPFDTWWFNGNNIETDQNETSLKAEDLPWYKNLWKKFTGLFTKSA